MLYACDAKWWDGHKEGREFTGLRFSINRDAERKHGVTRIPCVYTRRSDGEGLGFCLEPPTIYTGENSGYQATNLMIHFGAAKILLLGFDASSHNGLSHWHGDHPVGFNNPTPYLYQSWQDCWATVPWNGGDWGGEIINCSRQTALECFPRARLEDCL